MSREVKRVPVDFDWPLRKVWPGFAYATPDCRITTCPGSEDSEMEWSTDALCPFHRAQWDDTIPYVQVEPPSGEGWQLWETVSEGSPVSPVFNSPEALARWLPTSGEFGAPRTYESALKFVQVGWAPSMVSTPETGLLGGMEYVGGESR